MCSSDLTLQEIALAISCMVLRRSSLSSSVLVWVSAITSNADVRRARSEERRVGKEWGGLRERIIDIAWAVELIHTYSLIHDDLPAIDNDDMRRGMPTCHKVFGEAMAILAGDALLASAFDVMANTHASTDEERLLLLKTIQEIARAAGSTGMVGGQVVDIESEGKDVAFPVLEYIHIHKTGELILASIRAGAIMKNAGDKELEAMTRYGEAIGLAFQIADDILDVEGNKEDTGKNVGGDAKKEKVTYPSILGIEESKKRARELADIARASVEGFGKKAEPLKEIAKYIVARKM